MGNLGGGEILVILLLALIVLGPQRLPDAARQIGRFMGELRRVSSDFQREVRSAVEEPAEQAARARGAAFRPPAAEPAEPAEPAAEPDEPAAGPADEPADEPSEPSPAPAPRAAQASRAPARRRRDVPLRAPGRQGNGSAP